MVPARSRRYSEDTSAACSISRSDAERTRALPPFSGLEAALAARRQPIVGLALPLQLVAVVPVSGTAGTGALYPGLAPGPSGLTKASFALVDHVRSIDKRRVCRMFGRVSQSELASIDEGLELFLGLAPGE